jgi:hypothetical protein
MASFVYLEYECHVQSLLHSRVQGRGQISG